MFDWFNNQPQQKRAIYGVLIGIILMTIPCYCLGLIALATAPQVEIIGPAVPGITPTATTPLFVTATPSNTPVPATATPTQPKPPTATLEPTPTQSFPPTITPTFTPLPSTAT
ncbi:MAG: hypothetical protein D6768_11355, partial [Chloroflexi bacterium]